MADKAPAEKAPAKKVAATKDAATKDAPVTTAEKSEPAEAPKARSAPAVKVPIASNRSSGGPSTRVRTLQVMLTDLGFYNGRVDGFYTSSVRNAVSALQQSLKNYDGRPHGTFDEATRTALLNSTAYNTTE